MEENSNVYEEDFYGRESEEVVTEVKGVTDEVVSYTYTGMSYPCILIREDFKCPEHRMIVISKMVKMSAREVKDIALYFIMGGELYKVGMLSGYQVKPLVDIVGLDNISAYYAEDKKLEGDKVYVLCS